jgi:uncharacterized delta-60 repeat protein
MQFNLNQIAVTLFAQFSFISAQAQDGILDNTFSSDGMVKTSIGGIQDFGISVAIQSDGKILQGGYSYNGSNFDFALTRYNSNGTLDTGFDIDGIVTTDFAGLYNEGRTVVVQADGKILLAGVTYNGSNYDFAMARYNPDGSLDDSFGVLGKVKTDISGSNDYVNSIIIQPDQKIIVGGTSYNGSEEDFTVARYNSDGSLDLSFSSDGITTIDFTNSIDTGISLSLQDDGKIVFGGWTGDYPSSDFALVRLNEDGTLDSSFDSDGKVFIDLQSSYDQLSAVVVQNDGKILLGGTTSVGFQNNFSLIRLNSDGSLDTDFNTTGKLLIDAGPENLDYGTALALQSDGKILFGGYSTDGSNGDFVLVRIFENGVLDLNFDFDGKVSTDFAGANDQAFAIAVQNDNNILLAGTSDYEFAMARYEVDFCSLVATVNFNGNQLQTDISSANYQWIDCNNGDAAISGEISQSFTPLIEGNYAVVVESNGCIDTSDCILVSGLSTNDLEEISFSILPNPTAGLLTISSQNLGDPISLELFSVDGDLKAEYLIEDGLEHVLDISFLPSGFYLVKLKQNDKIQLVKLIKN